MVAIMKKTVCLLCALLLLCGAGCANQTGQPPQRRYEGSFIDVFDTVTKVILYETDEQSAAARMEGLHQAFVEYHQLFDIYHDYEGVNNLKTVNDNAGVAPVKVDERIMDLLLFSKEAYELTQGRVNIAMGSVLRVWHEYRQAGIDAPQSAELPPMELLDAAAEHTDINDLVVDEEAGTVFLRDPHMRLDVGAIAKGYAVQQVALRQAEEGVSSLLLSVGGNVCAIGRRADGKDWKVSVQSPDMSGSLLSLAVNGQSLVTSGVYQRYYTVGGARYHHIIDPQTLMPAAYFDAVSILCEDSALADALSTAVFNMPLEQGRALVERLNGVEALWVTPDGALIYSSGFALFIAEEDNAGAGAKAEPERGNAA